MKPIIGLVVVGLLIGPAAAAHEPLQAGAAKVDITPPVGFPLWGYAARHDAPSTAVLDPLQARALVLAVGKVKLALVSLDLGRAPSRQSLHKIRQQVREAAGVEHLFLVASHTHHGPVLEMDDWPTPEKSYVGELDQKLAGVIVEAARNCRPARLGIAARETDLNRNRHSRRPERPVDRALIVARVDDLAGKPLAVLINFAAHPTMIDAKDRRLSADYPGALAQVIEKETGAVCLFLQGAAGDLSPNPGKKATPAEFGEILGRQVLELATTIKPTMGAKTTLAIRERSFTFAKRLDLGNPLVHTALSLAFFKGLIDFYEREYRPGVRPQLTTAVLAGRIGLVGVSGEFFCGHALSLKKRARLDHLLFLGYCNDYHQYFPTIEAVAEGGYGTEPFVAPAEIGAGERIIDQALMDLFKLRGQKKEE